MTELNEPEDEVQKGKRPPRAVVGSHRPDEEVFGKADDPKIVRRIWAFVRPYRKQMLSSVGSVLVFTLSQLAIPLIIRYATDNGMAVGTPDISVLQLTVAMFIAVILVNYAANYVQEVVVGRVAENVLFDMRLAMFAH